MLFSCFQKGVIQSLTTKNSQLGGNVFYNRSYINAPYGWNVKVSGMHSNHCSQQSNGTFLPHDLCECVIPAIICECMRLSQIWGGFLSLKEDGEKVKCSKISEIIFEVLIWKSRVVDQSCQSDVWGLVQMKPISVQSSGNHGHWGRHSAGGPYLFITLIKF